jgi:hypothetical protein
MMKPDDDGRVSSAGKVVADAWYTLSRNVIGS